MNTISPHASPLFLALDYFVETCADMDGNKICAGVLSRIAQYERNSSCGALLNVSCSEQTPKSLSVSVGDVL